MIARGSGSAVEADLVCNMLILPCYQHSCDPSGVRFKFGQAIRQSAGPLKPTRRQVLKELSGGNKAFSVPCTPQVAGHRIPVSRAEAMEAKHFGDPGLRLFGFKCLGRWPDFKGPAGIRDDQRDQWLSWWEWRGHWRECQDVSGCVMVFLSSKVLAAKLVMPAVAQSARENLVSACLHAPKTVQGHPISWRITTAFFTHTSFIRTKREFEALPCSSQHSSAGRPKIGTGGRCKLVWNFSCWWAVQCCLFLFVHCIR